MSDIWQRLGIPPTTDQAVLREAYATRLKQVRPDVDPAGFRALREAFEAARRIASRGGGAPGGTVVRPVPPGGGPALPATPPPSAAIRLKIRFGHAMAAVRDFHRAVSLGEISFDEEPVLREEIAQAMLAAPSPGFAALDEAVRLMGWAAAAKALDASAATVQIMERHAAEAWLAELRAAAAGRWHWRPSRRNRARAARLLLRPAPCRLSRWFPYVLRGVDLAAWRKGLAKHRPWIGHEIDSQRVMWCLSVERRLDARLVNALYIFVVYVFVPVVVGVPVLALTIAEIIDAFSSGPRL
jgi:hypothetical protein